MCIMCIENYEKKKGGIFNDQKKRRYSQWSGIKIENLRNIRTIMIDIFLNYFHLLLASVLELVPNELLTQVRPNISPSVAFHCNDDIFK